ncbi:MAG: hypothetical protein ABSA74_00830, partial [Candidatus Staskawiczbacteria bacterium]
MKKVFENALITVEVSDSAGDPTVDVCAKGEGNVALSVTYRNGVFTVCAIERGVLVIPDEQNPHALHVEIRPRSKIPDSPVEPIIAESQDVGPT